ncbi:Tegument protein UL47 [Cacatuid alphaherpesvirus 2]|uniref:Tegument protein UL47 n=1 Tax=Cacatuid alphaherpesvirus 2 TaxID=2604840 RepID=A0A5B9R2E5_9ALPH|nr:Tegument protein UL47 [Cacatuid alphaherpesvirus 2]QEG54056.1 Tegument protein UL47 [Cacatuid alphaherpesvirus 2]
MSSATRRRSSMRRRRSVSSSNLFRNIFDGDIIPRSKTEGSRENEKPLEGYRDKSRHEIDPSKIDNDNDPFVSNKEYGGKWDVNGPADSTAEVLAQSWDVLTLVDAEEVANEQETFEEKASPVKPFGAWPGGQTWQTLPELNKAPILYPSAAIIESDAIKVGAYVSRKIQCGRFAAEKKNQRPTARALQSFLEAAFWRVMQNCYSVSLRFQPKIANVSRYPHMKRISPSDPNWFAISNQFFWRGMRIPSLLLPTDVPIEENVERGPAAALFRNAGVALLLWPWARASLGEREKRLARTALWSLDILDAVALASFPYYWKPHARDKRFEENLDCLAEYFGMTVLLVETVLSALLDHTLAFMKSLGTGTYDNYDEGRFIDPVKNKYLLGVEGVSLTRLNTAGTALSVVCANTYATLRNLPSVATSYFVSDYKTELGKPRKPSREDLFALLQREALFYTLWLQRMAVHLNLCCNVIRDAVMKGKQEFPLRRSALVRHTWVQKLLLPLTVPMSSQDFAVAKKEIASKERIETYVKSVPVDARDPRGTVRFITSDHVKELMDSFDKYEPILDEPMPAKRAIEDVFDKKAGALTKAQRSKHTCTGMR